jgi:hypothetical protein
MRKGYRYLSIVFMRNSLGIHYDNLGLYKELLDLIEAKAWKVNELVILTIHLTKVTKDVIEVFAIDILPPFSNRCHNHVEEIRTCALRKMADSNSVDLLVGFNSGLKQDYGSKTRKRKNNNTKDRSLDVANALPLIAMLSRRGVYIPPNGLAIPGCRMNVRIWRAKAIKDRCLKKIGQCEHMPR